MARIKVLSLTGQTIGKWSVGESFSHATRGERMYFCVCKCGTKKEVKHTHLSTGKTHSCGCSWTKHGMARSKQYRVWDSMIRRCHSPSHHAFKDYGARGITVCDKWKNFEGFIEDMGFQPEGLSIERINNDLGYSKENCKWATVTEQARNRRATKLNEDKVVQIKILLETGVSQNKIASQFSVSRSNIGHIAQGTTWRQL
jgi:predicted XRE-type DNA-binding protein